MRAVLLIEGTPPPPLRPADERRPTRQAALAQRLSAQNVHVAIRPGRDAEFIQMMHPFESQGAGRLLTIAVGDVYCLDRIRIRMDALVGPGSGVQGEAEVGQLVVLSHLLTTDGGLELQTVSLPIRVSAAWGGRVDPDIRTMPISVERTDRRRLYTLGPLDMGEVPPQCA